MRRSLGQLQIQITSIFEGMSSLYDSSGEGQYLDAIGIDEELALGNLVKPSGAISPTRFAKFSSLLSSPPMWISGGNTTSGVYVYELNGSVISYGSGLTVGSEAFEGSPGSESIASGAGNGMIVWNDYLYCSTSSTISRKGRLSTSGPTWQYDYWVGGLSMSALTNSSYPTTRSVTYPNHVMHAHTDGYVYVLDYDGANGRVHAFITDNTGANSTGYFNVMVLPPGYMPMDAKSYGQYLAVLGAPEGKYASGSIPKPGKASLFLFDTVNTGVSSGSRPNMQIPIPETLATCLINKGGELYVVAGDIDASVKLLHYLGGYHFEALQSIAEGSPPPAGAADTVGNMIAWGSYMTVPATAAGAMAYGHRGGNLPPNSLRHIARISDSSSGTLPIVTCLKFLQRNNHPILGWRTDTPANFGLDKIDGSVAYNSIWDSAVTPVGREFTIRRIRLPLSVAVSAGVTITATVFVDNESASTVLPIINSTNYASSERIIDFNDLSIVGYTNFSLRLVFTGTTEVAVLLPITIDYDIHE